MKYFNTTAMAMILLLGRAHAWGGTEPEPEPNFDDVACDFVDCLDYVLAVFDDGPITWGDEKIDAYIDNSRQKIETAETKMSSTGQVIVASDRVKQGMKWIELARSRAVNLGKGGAKQFSNRVGRKASRCAYELAEDLIDSADCCVASSVVLEAEAATNAAKEEREDQNWTQSAKESLKAVRAIMNDLDEREIPACIENEEGH